MPHVKIELLDVDCLDTQIDANGKKVYFIGVFATKDIIKTVMTTLIETKREKKAFEREQIVLFEGTVPPGEKIKVVLIVHGEQARKSFSNYQEVINQIDTAAGSALLEAKAQKGVHTSAMFSQTASATNTLIGLEKDNELAYQKFEIDADGITVEELNLNIKGGNSLGSTWYYTAQYRIVRS